MAADSTTISPLIPTKGAGHAFGWLKANPEQPGEKPETTALRALYQRYNDTRAGTALYFEDIMNALSREHRGKGKSMSDLKKELEKIYAHPPEGFIHR